MKKLSVIIIAVIVSLMLLFTGCGDKTGDTLTTTTTKATTTTKPVTTTKPAADTSEDESANMGGAPESTSERSAIGDAAERAAEGAADANERIAEGIRDAQQDNR